MSTAHILNEDQKRMIIASLRHCARAVSSSLDSTGCQILADWIEKDVLVPVIEPEYQLLLVTKVTSLEGSSTSTQVLTFKTEHAAKVAQDRIHQRLPWATWVEVIALWDTEEPGR